MASFRESLDEDLNVDSVLQQYMFEIEHCTTDFSQAPPSLQDLSPLSNLQQPTSTTDAGIYESLFPSAVQQPSSSTFPDSPGRKGSFKQEADDVPGPKSTTGTKRTEAWAAKNRRAQKRFRERQKVSDISVLFAFETAVVSNLLTSPLGWAGTERADGTTACSISRKDAAAQNGKQQNVAAQQHLGESA